MLNFIKRPLDRLLDTANMPNRRPELRAHNESNVDDMYIIGDLAGAPVIKLAMEQGYEVIHHIASLPGAKGSDSNVYDVVIAGAGAAGLNAALEAKEAGLSCLLLEKSKIANTIENFPEKKWVYAEPDSKPPKGKLWLDGARKEDLVARWNEMITENDLDVRREEGVESITRADKKAPFVVKTSKSEYRARRVIIAIGQRGNPRKLGVPGEEQERVYHRLYSPRIYEGEDILVVGGGNSAIEAALVLSEANRVTLSYRGAEFGRVFKDNERQLKAAVSAGRIEVIYESNVLRFDTNAYTLERKDGGTKREEERKFDHAFVLVGAELPVGFLRSVGIRLENEWHGNWLASLGLTIAALFFAALYGPDTRMAGLAANVPPIASGALALVAIAALFVTASRGNKYSWLGISFLACFTAYGAKVGNGEEFWPFRGWGYEALSFGNRPWSFWYTVLYTVLMTVFGIQAMKRWGFDRRDSFQIWRYVSLIGFQWIFFFLIPEFLFQWAVQMHWVGDTLANDPQFAGQAWRSYGVVYAWPLFFYTFFYDPHQIWIIWGVVLTFVLIPILSFFHGKRFCSWICGCGGLAETLGDRWRHLAPKGKGTIRWEWMNMAVLIFAIVVTVGILIKDSIAFVRAPSEAGLHIYRIYVDVWLVGILPVTLYPFLGGKVWCRFWCPLAKLMGLYSKWFGRFQIKSNDKCIACTECTRNCQVGIDVMSYALKQEPLTNNDSSCIGCGICVTVCPMDVLSFGDDPAVTSETKTALTSES